MKECVFPLGTWKEERLSQMAKCRIKDDLQVFKKGAWRFFLTQQKEVREINVLLW